MVRPSLAPPSDVRTINGGGLGEEDCALTKGASVFYVGAPLFASSSVWAMEARPSISIPSISWLPLILGRMGLLVPLLLATFVGPMARLSAIPALVTGDLLPFAVRADVLR